MFISVLARRLKPGKTYEDFVAAWYPDKGFGVPRRGPYLARSASDPIEILAIAFIDLPDRAAAEAAAGRLASGATSVSVTVTSMLRHATPSWR